MLVNLGRDEKFEATISQLRRSGILFQLAMKLKRVLTVKYVSLILGRDKKELKENPIETR